jgi:hypothetical protein
MFEIERIHVFYKRSRYDAEKNHQLAEEGTGKARQSAFVSDLPATKDHSQVSSMSFLIFFTGHNTKCRLIAMIPLPGSVSV